MPDMSPCSPKRTSSINPQYLIRMDRHSSVHHSKYMFEIGDNVIVAENFDNNTKTKKQKLTSFCSTEMVILECHSNDRVKVGNKDKIEIVHNSRLKKVVSFRNE